MVSEEFEDDAAFLESCVIWLTNGDVKVSLRILRVELGQHVGFRVLNGCFVLVDTAAEETRERCRLLFVVLSKSLFAHFPVCSEHLVIQVELDSVFHIGASIIESEPCQVSLRPKEECFHGGGVCSERPCAHLNALFPVLLLQAHVCNVLHEDYFELFQVLVLSLDGAKMLERVKIMIFCLLELASLKLRISFGLESFSGCDELFVRQHPFGGAPVIAHKQLNGENKSCICRDFATGVAGLAVAVGGSDGELGLLAKLHGHDADVPAADHLPGANSNFKCIFVIICVKGGPIYQSTLIVDKHFLPSLRQGTFHVSLSNYLFR